MLENGDKRHEMSKISTLRETAALRKGLVRMGARVITYLCQGCGENRLRKALQRIGESIDRKVFGPKDTTRARSKTIGIDLNI